MTRREATKITLQQINGFLQSMGKNIQDFGIVPQEFSSNDLEDQAREIRAEKDIIVSQEDLDAIFKLNERQKSAFETIIEKAYSSGSGAFFVDGPGGTGKTYLYRALLAKVTSKGHIALATATPGIAASILPGGRTAHSRFKIPLDAVEGSGCRVSKQSSLAALIRDSRLIIWDEAPMAKRSAIEALNDLLQDLMNSTELFGGKVVVLGRDFRQTLLVVRKGTKSETLDACITNSPIWPSLQKLWLEEIMRALLDPIFTEFLLKIGNGTETSHKNDLVNIPPSMLIQTHLDKDPLDALIDCVYPNTQLHSLTTPCYLNRAILTTKNSFVDEINEILIARFPVFIHRIPLQPPSDEDYTVPFKRVQFPIRLCFAMTINKAQGQTLDFVGVYLKEPVFSHGQLYVALSRARTAKHAKVLIRPPLFDAPNIRETKNIVYQEVLQISEYVDNSDIYSWIINNKSLVEELVESIPTLLPCEFEFIKFTDLYKYADSESPQSLSLSTRGSSGLMIDPPVTHDLQMQEWYNANKAELEELLNKKSYKNSDILLPYPKDEDIISISTVVASLRNWKISLPRQDRSTWFTACANCKKSLEADLTWIVTCPLCHQESEVEALSRMTIQIDDGTTTLYATIGTPDVEKIVPYTAVELKDADEHIDCRALEHVGVAK
ncbi:ATP-dependent DNA helicase PIF1-like protein [Tanacetum coccineum]